MLGDKIRYFWNKKKNTGRGLAKIAEVLFGLIELIAKNRFVFPDSSLVCGRIKITSGICQKFLKSPNFSLQSE